MWKINWHVENRVISTYGDAATPKGNDAGGPSPETYDSEKLCNMLKFIKQG